MKKILITTMLATSMLLSNGLSTRNLSKQDNLKIIELGKGSQYATKIRLTEIDIENKKDIKELCAKEARLEGYFYNRYYENKNEVISHAVKGCVEILGNYIERLKKAKRY